MKNSKNYFLRIKILTVFALLCSVHDSYADTVSIDENSKSSAEFSRATSDVINAEIKKRHEFFESLEKLPQNERDVAIERWRSEEDCG
jgi:hypothetical protein